MKIFHKLLLIFCFLALPAIANSDTRFLSTDPQEIYGTHKNIGITIGNGGAGPTGILRALSEDYLQNSNKEYSIAWLQDISIHNLQHLKKGTIDIALVYEKLQGMQAQKAGWASHYTPIFNDHFLIVGPKTNPAKIDEINSPVTAFKKISTLGDKISTPVFLSRNDNSGTNVKERSIWKLTHLKPWENNFKWYFKYHAFPKDALIYADKNLLYTITDWGTWLSNQQELANSKIYIRGGKGLLNTCFALLQKNPSAEALEFLEYLKSDRAQNIIANFGKDKYNGLALFTPAAQTDF